MGQQELLEYLRDCWRERYRITAFWKLCQMLGFLGFRTIKTFTDFHRWIMQHSLVMFLTLGPQDHSIEGSCLKTNCCILENSQTTFYSNIVNRVLIDTIKAICHNTYVILLICILIITIDVVILCNPWLSFVYKQFNICV